MSCSSCGQFTNGRTSASAVAMLDASQWRAQTSRQPPIGGHPTCLALPSPCSKPTRASHVRVLRGTRERQHSPTQSPSPHNRRLALIAKRVLFRHLNNPEKLWCQFMGFFHIIGIGIVQRDRSSKAAAFLSPLVGCRRFFFRNNVLLISLARVGLAPPSASSSSLILANFRDHSKGGGHTMLSSFVLEVVWSTAQASVPPVLPPQLFVCPQAICLPLLPCPRQLRDSVQRGTVTC